MLLANNIRLLSKDATHLAITDRDVLNIKKVRTPAKLEVSWRKAKL